MCIHDKADAKFLDSIVEIVGEIRHDIIMENYEDARKKIILLGELLNVVKEGSEK